MIYGINDKLPIKRLITCALQQVMACFVATILIPQICGVPIAPAMIGACIGTLIYQLCTRSQSPMFISSSGAFCAAVIGALAAGGYTAVAIGGIIVGLVYCLVALVIKKTGTAWIDKLMPPAVIGSVVAIIGLNLATYIPTYFQVNGQYSLLGFGLGILTMLIAACVSHYGKGFIKNLPFLVAMSITYVLSIILTLCGIPLVDFTAFQNMQLIQIPDFSLLHMNFANFNWSILPQLLLLWVPLACVTIAEHISDHKALSAIIGTDLTQKPGLAATIAGDGLASVAGIFLSCVPNTSYGESVGATGFSRVCSKYVITLAAVIMGIASIFGPLQAILVSMPSFILGGCAAILYGYITLSGIRTLKEQVDLSNNKNIIIIAAVLTLGVSGAVCDFGIVSIGTTALAMLLGIILNLILKEKRHAGTEVR